MIHFDDLDLSEWHSEEVINFFWRSVYMNVIFGKNVRFYVHVLE